MPPAYRRMLMILAIFLASMMLIGRIDFGLSDEPVVPPHVQAMMEHQKAQEAEARARTGAAMAQAREYDRNPYLNRDGAGRDCQGDEVASQLRQLRDLQRQIDSDIDYAEQGNPESLDVMQETEEALSYLRTAPCLGRAREQLQVAARSARSDMRSLSQQGDLTSHEIQKALRESIRWSMDLVQRELDNVQESLDQG